MERNGSRPDDGPPRFGRGQHAIRAQSLRKFEHGNNRLHNGRLAGPYFVHGGEQKTTALQIFDICLRVWWCQPFPGSNICRRMTLIFSCITE